MTLADSNKPVNIKVISKDTPIDGIVDYADIENVDLDQIDGIKTGIKELDKRSANSNE